MSDTNASAGTAGAGHGGTGTDGSRAPVEANLKSKSTWLRLLFIVIFWVLAQLAALVAAFVVVLGFLWVLFTGETNDRLTRAGQGIATYIYQVLRYLTFNSDERPFPIDADWPAADAGTTTPG